MGSGGGGRNKRMALHDRGWHHPIHFECSHAVADPLPPSSKLPISHRNCHLSLKKRTLEVTHLLMSAICES